MGRVTLYRFNEGGRALVCENGSKVVCPHCTRPMPIEEFQENMDRAPYPWIRKKCKGCKRFIAITIDGHFDYVGVELKKQAK